MSDLKEQLLPCPFCGGTNLSTETSSIQPDNFHDAYIYCADCEAQGRRAAGMEGWLSSKEEAKTEAAVAWNRRAPAAAPAPVAASELTDLSKRLRERATGGYFAVSQDDADLMLSSAEEIERYYGAMLAWKKTAEKKDADWNAERMAREDDRIAARAALAAAPAAGLMNVQSKQAKRILDTVAAAPAAAPIVQPVAYADPQAFRNFAAGTATNEWMWAKPDAGLVPMFAAPTVQAPVGKVVETDIDVSMIDAVLPIGAAVYLAPTPASSTAAAKDAARYRYVATLQDWSDIERMCWSSPADSAEQFKRDLDKYIDAAIASSAGEVKP